MTKIKITVHDLAIEAELFETHTAKAIEGLLPLEGSVNLWGDELYFTIPLKVPLEPDARETVEAGELGYWPQGPALCVFFGPTPASTDQRPRAYSPVNVFGRAISDATVLKDIPDGAKITVTLAKK